jgi:DNA-binding response OmpR family regulator
MSATGEAPLILVVDDDDLVRAWIVKVLREGGYRVAEAEDGKQGLAIARRQAPAVVVLDMFMMGKEGLETILDLRKECLATRVLAISGGPSCGYDVLKVATLLGAGAALAKPFSEQMLLERVRELVQGSAATRLDAAISDGESAQA